MGTNRCRQIAPARSSAPRSSNTGRISSSTYKVRGKFDAQNGVAVLGHNTATTGTPAGVKGEVDYSGGWGIYIPDDARLDGILATQNFHRVTVNGNRALFLGSESSGDAGNVIAGHSSNQVNDDYGVVAGGRRNQAGDGDSDDSG